MIASALTASLAGVREEIARVQQSAGIRHEVRIVAVTKGHPASVVREARDAGLRDVGENRVQEALEKQEQLSDLDVRWHLIGHLQTNKARYIPGAFAMVQSVDSLRIAEALAQAVRRRGGRLAVLAQVNVAGEEQKSGCAPADAPALVAGISRLAELDLQGLMTMAPFTTDESTQRRAFSGLRVLRDRLASPALPLPELSMGMSGDYRAAVAEGATILRLGTILFGDRTP
jgi:pyridoxal phosphate enzyme (YggS family)